MGLPTQNHDINATHVRDNDESALVDVSSHQICLLYGGAKHLAERTQGTLGRHALPLNKDKRNHFVRFREMYHHCLVLRDGTTEIATRRPNLRWYMRHMLGLNCSDWETIFLVHKADWKGC